MKYKLRRALSILLAVIMLLSLLPTAAFAVDETAPGGTPGGSDITPDEGANELYVASHTITINNGVASIDLDLNEVPVGSGVTQVTLVIASTNMTQDHADTYQNSDYSSVLSRKENENKFSMHDKSDDDISQNEVLPMWIYRTSVTNGTGTAELTATGVAPLAGSKYSWDQSVTNFGTLTYAAIIAFSNEQDKNFYEISPVVVVAGEPNLEATPSNPYDYYSNQSGIDITVENSGDGDADIEGVTINENDYIEINSNSALRTPVGNEEVTIAKKTGDTNGSSTLSLSFVKEHPIDKTEYTVTIKYSNGKTLEIPVVVYNSGGFTAKDFTFYVSPADGSTTNVDAGVIIDDTSIDSDPYYGPLTSYFLETMMTGPKVTFDTISESGITGSGGVTYDYTLEMYTMPLLFTVDASNAKSGETYTGTYSLAFTANGTSYYDEFTVTAIVTGDPAIENMTDTISMLNKTTADTETFTLTFTNEGFADVTVGNVSITGGDASNDYTITPTFTGTGTNNDEISACDGTGTLSYTVTPNKDNAEPLRTVEISIPYTYNDGREEKSGTARATITILNAAPVELTAAGGTVSANSTAADKTGTGTITVTPSQATVGSDGFSFKIYRKDDGTATDKSSSGDTIYGADVTFVTTALTTNNLNQYAGTAQDVTVNVNASNYTGSGETVTYVLEVNYTDDVTKTSDVLTHEFTVTIISGTPTFTLTGTNGTGTTVTVSADDQTYDTSVSGIESTADKVVYVKVEPTDGYGGTPSFSITGITNPPTPAQVGSSNVYSFEVPKNTTGTVKVTATLQQLTGTAKVTVNLNGLSDWTGYSQPAIKFVKGINEYNATMAGNVYTATLPVGEDYVITADNTPTNQTVDITNGGTAEATVNYVTVELNVNASGNEVVGSNVESDDSLGPILTSISTADFDFTVGADADYILNTSAPYYTTNAGAATSSSHPGYTVSLVNKAEKIYIYANVTQVVNVTVKAYKDVATATNGYEHDLTGSNYTFEFAGKTGTISGNTITFTDVPVGTTDALTIKKSSTTVGTISNLSVTAAGNIADVFFYTVTAGTAHNLTTTINTGGTGVFLSGEQVTLGTDGNIASGYTHSGWTDDGGTTSFNNSTYTVTEKVTITPTATAMKSTATLQVNVNNSGATSSQIDSVTLTGKGTIYMDASTGFYSEEINPGQNNTFTVKMKDGNSYDVVVAADTSKEGETQAFELDLYTVTVAQNATAEDSAGSASFGAAVAKNPVYAKVDDKVAVTAGKAKTGYTFSNSWTGNATVTNNRVTVVATNDGITVTPEYTWRHVVTVVDSASKAMSGISVQIGSETAVNTGTDGKATFSSLDTDKNNLVVKVNGYNTKYTATHTNGETTVTLYKIDTAVKYKVGSTDITSAWVAKNVDLIAAPTVNTYSSVLVPGNVVDNTTVTLAVSPAARYSNGTWSHTLDANNKFTVTGLTKDETITYTATPGWKLTLNNPENTASGDAVGGTITATVNGAQSKAFNGSTVVYAPVKNSSLEADLTIADLTDDPSTHVFGHWFKNGTADTNATAKGFTYTVTEDSALAPFYWTKPTVKGADTTYTRGTSTYPSYTVNKKDATSIDKLTINSKDLTGGGADYTLGGTTYILSSAFVNGEANGTYTPTFTYTLNSTLYNDLTSTLKIEGSLPTLTKVQIETQDGQPATTGSVIVYELHEPTTINKDNKLSYQWFVVADPTTITINSTGGSTVDTYTVKSGDAGKYVVAVVTASETGEGKVVTNAIPVTYSKTVTVNKDNNPYTDGTVSLTLDNSGGTQTTSGGTATFTGLVPGKTYTISAPSYIGGSTVSTGVSFSNTTTGDVVVNYYTVSFAQIGSTVNGYASTITHVQGGNPSDVINEALQSTSYPQLTAVLDGTNTAVTNSSNNVVLSGTKLDVTLAGGLSGAAADYTATIKQNGNGIGANAGNIVNALLAADREIKATTTFTAELDQNDYAVTIGIKKADGYSESGTVKSIIVEFNGTTIATYDASAGYTDQQTLSGFNVPMGNYTITATVSDPKTIFFGYRDIEAGTATGNADTTNTTFTVNTNRDGSQVVVGKADDVGPWTPNPKPGTPTWDKPASTPHKYTVEEKIFYGEETDPYDFFDRTINNPNSVTIYDVTVTKGTDPGTSTKITVTVPTTGVNIAAANGGTPGTTPFKMNFDPTDGNSNLLNVGTHTATFTVSAALNSGGTPTNYATYDVTVSILQDLLATVTITQDSSSKIISVATVTATHGADVDEGDEDSVTYEWFYADSLDEDGKPVDGKTTGVTGTTFDPFNPTDYKDKFIYVVATGDGNFTGTVTSNAIAIPYTATVTVNLDGSKTDNKTTPTVFVTTTEDGTGTKLHTWTVNGDHSFEAQPGVDYYVHATTYGGSGATTKVADITGADDATATVNYWTVTSGTAKVLHAATDGKFYETAPGNGVTLINPVTDGIATTLVPGVGNNVAVLENQPVTFTQPANGGIDYAFDWGSDTGTIKVASDVRTVDTATLTQNTYDVVVQVAGADGASVTALDVEFGSNNTVASLSGSATKTDPGKITPKLPKGTYTATGWVVSTGVFVSIADLANVGAASTAPVSFGVDSNGDGVVINTAAITIELVYSVDAPPAGVGGNDTNDTDLKSGTIINETGLLYESYATKTYTLTIKNNSNIPQTVTITNNSTTAGAYTFTTDGYTSGTEVTLAKTGEADDEVSVAITIPANQPVKVYTGSIVVTQKQTAGDTTTNVGLATFGLSYEVTKATLQTVTTDKGTASAVVDEEVSVKDLTANSGAPTLADADYEWFIDGEKPESIGTGEKLKIPASAAGKYIYVVATGKGNYDGTPSSDLIPVKYDATITIKVDNKTVTDDKYNGMVQLTGDGGPFPVVFDSGSSTYKVTGLLPGSYSIEAKAYVNGDFTDTEADITVEKPTGVVQYWTLAAEDVTVSHAHTDLGTLTTYDTDITYTVDSDTVSVVLHNTKVTFTASTWAEDYTMQWKSKESSAGSYGNVTGTNNTYSETIIHATTVTATLTQNTYPVTVRVIGSGKVTSFNIDASSPAVDAVAASTVAVSASTPDGTAATLSPTALPLGDYSIEDLVLATGTQLEGYSAGGSNPNTTKTFKVTASGGTIYIHVISPELKLEVKENETNKATGTYSSSGAQNGQFTTTKSVPYGSGEQKVTLTLKNTGTSGTLYDVTGAKKSALGDNGTFTASSFPSDSDMVVNAEDTVEISFNPSGQSVGTYQGTHTFTFAANDGGDDVAHVDHTFIVNIVKAKIKDLYLEAPKAPVAGGTPVTDAPTLHPVGNAGDHSGTTGNVTSETGLAGATVSEVKWLNFDGSNAALDSGKFKPGTEYKAQVTITLKDTTNYEFVSNFSEQYRDAINDNPTITIDSSSQITLTFTYGATAPVITEVDAEATGANATDLGLGSVDSIVVATKKPVDVYWVALAATATPPDADEITDPSKIADELGSGTATLTQNSSGVTTWSNAGTLKNLAYGTKYTVYAVAVYVDDPSAVSDVVSDTFKAWHKVIVTVEDDNTGTVELPQADADGAHIQYVAPGGTVDVKATPKTHYGNGSWSISSPTDDGKQGGFSSTVTDPKTGAISDTFTVGNDDDTAVAITLQATFTGESDIQWDTYQATANTLPNEYSSGIQIHTNTLTNVGVAVTGEVTIKLEYEGQPDGGNAISRGDASNYFTINPDWVTDNTNTLAEAGAADDKDKQVFTLSTGSTPLAAGTYTIYIVASNAADASDVETVEITLLVSGQKITLSPDTAYWDLNGTLTNHLETTAGKEQPEWVITVFGGAEVEGLTEILDENGDPIPTAAYTHTVSSSNNSKTITIDAEGTDSIQKYFDGKDVGDTVKFKVVLDTTAGDKEIDLTVKVVDSTPIVYAVDLPDTPVTSAGTTLTASITSVVDRDWKFGTTPGPDYENVTGIVPNGTNVVVNWYTSDNGTNWTLAQSNSADAGGYDKFTVTDAHMGKQIMVVVTDNADDVNYRPRATLSGTNYADYPVKDTIGTYLRVEAQVSTESGKGNGTIIVPPATTIDNEPVHVTYVEAKKPAAITAVPNPGYVFDGWTIKENEGAGTFDDATLRSTTFAPDENSIVIASFKQATITAVGGSSTIVYNTTSFKDVTQITAKSDGYNEKLTYELVDDDGNPVTTPDWLEFKDGVFSVKSAATTNVQSSSATEHIDVTELTYNVKITSLSGTEQKVTFTVNILPSQLTINGTPEYDDGAEQNHNAPFDPNKLNKDELIVTGEAGEIIANAELKWSMNPSNFDSTAGTVHKVVATYNPQGENAADRKWNYIEDDETLTVTVTNPQYGVLIYDDNADRDNDTSRGEQNLSGGSVPSSVNLTIENPYNRDLHNVKITLEGDNADKFNVNLTEFGTLEKDETNGGIILSPKGGEEWKTGDVYRVTVKVTGTETSDPHSTAHSNFYELVVRVGDTSIDVYVYVDPPVVGEKPDTDATVKSGDEDKYTAGDVVWYEREKDTDPWVPMTATDKFDDGKQYKVDVEATPKPGYTFGSNTVYYINDDVDSTASDIDVDGGTNITKIWTLPDVNFPIYVNVAKPAAGNSPGIPSARDTGKYDMANAATDYKWYNSDDTPLTGNFEAGKSYTLWVKVAVKDPYDNGDVTTRHINDGQLGGPTSFTVGTSGYNADGDITNELWYTWTLDPEQTFPPFTPVTPSNPTMLEVTYDLGSFGETTDPTKEMVEKNDYPSFTPNVTILEDLKDLATFVGWSLEKPDHVLEVELVDPLTVKITKDTTFYAVYEITEYEYHEHYMIGYPDGNFKPDKNITRAEVATIIARAALPDFIEGSWYGNGGYSDVEGHWAQSAIGFVTAAGVFEGYTDGTFRPNKPITREEYALVIARLKGLMDGTREDLSQFVDVADVSEWAIDGVYTCVEEGWIIGYNDDTFRARKDISRAEAAKMMNGYLNRGVDEPGTSTVPQYIQFPDLHWGHWAYWEVAEAVNDHYYYYYYVDAEGNDTPPEQWVIEAGYLNVKLDDNDPDNTKNVRRHDPIYVNSVSAGTGSSN